MTDKPAQIPRLLTPRQVSEATGYALGTIYNMINSGELPFIKSGTARACRLRIREDDYIAWYNTLKPRNPIKTRNYNRKRVA